jgi:hypothetical protein
VLAAARAGMMVMEVLDTGLRLLVLTNEAEIIATTSHGIDRGLHVCMTSDSSVRHKHNNSTCSN